MSLRGFFFILLYLLSSSVFAQRVEKVTAEYVYHAPENISLEEAKYIALERAKIQAIADTFGTIVSQSNFTTIANRNGKSDVDFFSLGGSEVKGEWIETIGKPEYAISYEKGLLVIKASVIGRIREIVSVKVDFKAKVLCNGTDLKYERSDFRNGDDLYLYFQTPVDGYLTVYLLDETTQMVYCLLPYKNSDKVSLPVRHDVPYVFFSQNASAEDVSEIDEYVMTCNREVERNVIYVVFSMNQFIKANSSENMDLMPRQLPFEDFQKWLVKCRTRDQKMYVEKKLIVIKNE